jgi:hypothetical protein
MCDRVCPASGIRTFRSEQGRRSAMIVVRVVMQAKFGKGGELAPCFVEGNR